MNYMYLDDNIDVNNMSLLINKYELKEETSDKYLNVKEILTTYNELKEISKKQMKELDNLHKENDKLIEYKNKIINNHTNHINILFRSLNENNGNNIDEVTQLIDKYDKALTCLYNSWNDTYYNKRLAKLENEMRESNEYLHMYQEFFRKIIKEFSENGDNQNKNMCSICFEKEVDMCSIPCGHTCCSNCVIMNNINTSNRNKCLNCRNNISQYIKIYFSL